MPLSKYLESLYDGKTYITLIVLQCCTYFLCRYTVAYRVLAFAQRIDNLVIFLFPALLSFSYNHLYSMLKSLNGAQLVFKKEV